MNLYSCEVPSCDEMKEVVTPAGYLCRSCANQVGQEVKNMSHQCDNCDHEGEPKIADYYGTDIEVCENCEYEL